MSRRLTTLQPEYFETLYAGGRDPWNFAASEYELEKYARTLAAMPKTRYAHGLEIGCSIGVFTQMLALRCDRLLAVDAAEAALSQAQRRCAECDNVEFMQMFVPRQWPAGHFDLIVLSEVVYYLEVADVAQLVARVDATLSPAGQIVLVHWTGETDYPLTGDNAAEMFIAGAQDFAEVVEAVRRPEYRLDILVRR